MSGRLADRVAWVTGAGRGLGRAIALAYAEEGAALVLTARSKPDLEDVAQEARRCGASVVIAPGDVRLPRDMDAAAQMALERFGRVDVLVNNAGVWIQKPFLEFSVEEWALTMDTNVTGVFHCSRAVLPGMIARKRGRIINLASIDGQFGFPRLVPQCASKAAVIGFTRALAKELWDQGIAVTAICPAAVDKSGPETSIPSRLGAPSVKLVPADVARTAVFLASSDADAVSGVTIDVYGVGFLAS